MGAVLSLIRIRKWATKFSSAKGVISLSLVALTGWPTFIEQTTLAPQLASSIRHKITS
jgi:hypothetical protein